MKYRLDSEEQEILDAFERSELRSRPDTDEAREAREAARNREERRLLLRRYPKGSTPFLDDP